MSNTQDPIMEDGENRAVRGFLLGREMGIKGSDDMKRHMKNYGTPFWPEWVEQRPQSHMSKAAQQSWLRHLFALENSLQPAAAQPQDSRPVCSADGCNRREPCGFGCRDNGNFDRQDDMGIPISGDAAAQPQGDARESVLAHLDALKDDAAVHIYPSDLEKCSTSECVVEVVSVRATDMKTGERTVPLFSREQVAEALQAATMQSLALQPPVDIREAFEAWWDEDGLGPLDHSWDAWKAGAAWQAASAQGFTAHDMATAAADGFRAGVASTQASEPSTPLLYLNPKIIDPRTGKVAVTAALTWSDKPVGGWTMPVYTAAPARAVEPTPEMLERGVGAHYEAECKSNEPGAWENGGFAKRSVRAAHVYRAMLAAAPQPGDKT